MIAVAPKACSSLRSTRLAIQYASGTVADASSKHRKRKQYTRDKSERELTHRIGKANSQKYSGACCDS